MTTKWKIVIGFTLSTLMLAVLALIGYRSLSRSTELFTEYDRIANLNVTLSDMSTALGDSGYRLERYLSTHDAGYMQQSMDAIAKASDLAQKALPFVKNPERRTSITKSVETFTQYSTLLGRVRTDMESWRQAYTQSIQPAMAELTAMLSLIGDNGTKTGDLQVLNVMNRNWKALAGLNALLVSFAEAPSEDGAKAIVAALAGAGEPVEDLKYATMRSESDQQNFAKYAKAFASLAATFEAKKAASLQALKSIEQSYGLDREISTAISTLSREVDRDMAEYREVVRSENSFAQSEMLGISVGGLVLSLIFALFIIITLNRTLVRVSLYAGAVANGDFDYKAQIREKGEIGRMVAALDRIPAILRGAITNCTHTANQISCGEMRARLNPEEFAGSFKDLASGINALADAYTKVLDVLPLSIVGVNLDRKLLFLNVPAQKISGGNTVGAFCGDKFGAEECKSEATCLGKKCINARDMQKAEVKVGNGDTQAHLDVTAVPLYDLHGKPAGWIETTNDVTQIRKQQLIIADVARQAADISNRVAAASEELASQVEQISRGAEMQRERVESTAGAMSEMNSTVLEVARNAGQASDQSESTRSNAVSGADLVNKVVHSINDVNKVATKLQDNMAELGKQAESIGGVMNVISDIADQTNLLALNAAIEAARAGEAGRGFAVVADEVRKLAEKTMSATQEVGANIRAIQQSAKNNIEEVGGAVQSVHQATELANSSGMALKGIVDLAAATSSLVASIATAAEEQSATSEEITRAIEEINNVIGETTQGMVQSSQAVQDLSRTAQELRRVLDHLK